MHIELFSVYPSQYPIQGYDSILWLFFFLFIFVVALKPNKCPEKHCSTIKEWIICKHFVFRILSYNYIKSCYNPFTFCTNTLVDAKVAQYISYIADRKKFTKND